MNTINNIVKSVLITLLVTVSLAASAQTQQGIVKTRGRMVNGVLQRGKGLPDAMVQIKEHSSVKSEKDGTFSFPLRTKNYLVESVKKQGYQLVDNDACRSYRYSDEPVCLVMETPEQQRSDLLAAERKIRRNLQRQLQEREEEIEALKVSQKEKDSLLHIVYQQQTDNERLINEMAKRYSTLDYDQLDEFYRQVSSYIENGELTRADSLLRTRGDINAQVKAIINQGQAIQEQSELLHKADSVHKRDVEEAARRCYSYYETFFAQHQNDSAAYYLELRIKIDSTNIVWLNTIGDFFLEYLADYSNALKYYDKELTQAIRQFGPDSHDAAICYNNIGLVYKAKGDYSKAFSYLELALNNNRSSLGEKSAEVADNYLNMANLLNSMSNEKDALSYASEALNIYLSIYGEQHLSVSLCYGTMGSIYVALGEYEKAILYHEKSLIIKKNLLGGENIDVAIDHNNLCDTYVVIKKYDKALENGEKALALFIKILGEKHPLTATGYSNIGKVYTSKKDLERALCYLNKALDIRLKILGESHNDVATSYNNLGVTYNYAGQFDKALESHLRALKIKTDIFGESSSPVAVSICNIGTVYTSKNDFVKALEYYESAYKIFITTLSPNHPNIKLVEKKINETKAKLK